MSKFEIEFIQEADIEITEAYVYYENQLNGLGDRFLYELERLINIIIKSPNAFQIFNSTNKTRQVPMDVFPFVIIYRIDKKKIVFLAVFGTNQNPVKKVR
jgi:hypothetical protein